MTIGTVCLLPLTGDVHGMFKFQACQTGLQFSFRTLYDNGMAGSTVVGDRFAFGAGVVTVVATEAAGEIHVPDIIRINPPIHFHAGEKIVPVNVLHFLNSRDHQR